MTEQNKLRKFKLIDREGYLASFWYNKTILEEHLQDECIMGFEHLNGDIGDLEGSDVFIEKGELIFFEEVFDEDEKLSPTRFPFNGYICRLVGQHPMKGSKSIYVREVDNKIGEIETKLLIELMKPKPWQEQLCDEFGLDYNSLGFGFQHTMTEERTIEFAKRVIELSGE